MIACQINLLPSRTPNAKRGFIEDSLAFGLDGW